MMQRRRGRKVMLAGAVAVLASWLGCQSTAMTSAKVYIQQNDWPQAREQLRLAVAETPQDSEAQMLLGVAEATLGDLAAAATAFDAAEADTARAEEAGRWRRKFWVETFNVGLTALKAGSLDEAEAAFREATVLDPDEAPAFRNLGVVFEQKNQLQAAFDDSLTALAMEAYHKAVELDPADTTTALQMGYLHYLRDEFAAAIEWIEPRAAGVADAGYYRVLASAHDQLGHEDKALAALKMALDLQPDDAELLNDVAGIYLRHDDYASAIDYLSKANELSPQDRIVGYNYALALIHLEREPEALSVLEAMVERDDGFVDGWDLLSQLYLRAGRAQEGQAAYDKAEALRAGE